MTKLFELDRNIIRRYFENLNDFGKLHAFLISMCGSEDEKLVLVARIIEWNKGYPELNNYILPSFDITEK